MIAKLISFVVALAAAAAAAAVLVVSASYALYAFLRTYVGPAGSSACLTLAAAVVLAALAVFLFSRTKGKPAAKAAGKGRKGETALADRIAALVGDKPVVAAAAAVAAGLLAWRNPTLVNTLLKLTEQRSDRRRA